MIKRIFSILLAFLMLVGVFSVSSVSVLAEEENQETTQQEATESQETTKEAEPTEPEDTGMHISDECMVILKKEEGFSKKPYWDYTQYTVGFGTQCPEDMRAYYTEHGITEQEAEDLLRNHLMKVEEDLNKFAEKYNLTWTQNQFDAILLFSYNCGTGWCYTPTTSTFHQYIAKGATGNDLIRAFALWCSAGGEIKDYLLRRRLSEANMYLNGIYSQTPPDNYCYVLYDANGGKSEPRSQGYNSEWPVAPFPVPVYEGYTFAGWYTAKNGGQQVTELNASTKGKTLYAYWKDADGNIKDNTEPEVRVTVTGVDVNVRKGPGTNYTRIGTVTKGDKLTIVETASGSPSRWGRYTEKGGGWICLQYTNYEAALKELGNGGTTEPPVTEPTEPPVTEPTEPPVTEPTEPETTEPTEPPVTEPTEPPEEPKKIMGTVKVNEFLRVRKGPSTGYAEVCRLKPNDRVEILEQKIVGATVWGRISQGWISMDYVKLDSTDNSDTGNTGGSDNTGNDGNTGSTAPAGTTGTIVNCSQWVRIRSGAGTGYSIAGYYYPGDKVTITEQKTVGSIKWGKTEKGWVSMDYVKLDSTSSGNTGSAGGNGGTTGGTATTAKTGKIVNCSEWVRIRSGAGTSYSIAGYYYPGDKVTITEQKTVGSIKWGKTEKGWVSMDYVQLDTTSSGTTEPAKVIKTITADCLNVRNKPGTSGTSVVAYLYYGTKVEILETTTVNGTQWGRISSGWISMDYAK